MTTIIFDEALSHESFDYKNLDSKQQILRLPLPSREFYVNIPYGLLTLYVGEADNGKRGHGIYKKK